MINLQDIETQLDQIRAKIDAVDTVLAENLLHRLKLADEIGRLKARTGDPTMSKSRQAEILHKLSTQFPELHPSEIHEVWQTLFKLSIARQLQIIEK
jgi:chorismate mutase